jgi:hypothetical protein
MRQTPGGINVIKHCRQKLTSRQDLILLSKWACSERQLHHQLSVIGRKAKKKKNGRQG